MLTNTIIVGYGLTPVEQDGEFVDIETNCVKSVLENTEPGTYLLSYIDNFENKVGTLTKIWNDLIRSSTADYICLLNSDTVVYPGWLSKMTETLCVDDTFGFVGPSTSNCHSPQKNIPTFEEAAKYATREDKVEVMKDPISGFCVLFRPYTWRKLKGFDERYSFYGAESDFIDRAKTQLGLVSVWRKDAFVYHYGEMSIKKSGMDVNKAREQAKKIYWSTRKK